VSGSAKPFSYATNIIKRWPGERNGWVEAVGGLAKSATKQVPARRAQEGDDPPNGIDSAAVGRDQGVTVMAKEPSSGE